MPVPAVDSEKIDDWDVYLDDNDDTGLDDDLDLDDVLGDAALDKPVWNAFGWEYFFCEAGRWHEPLATAGYPRTQHKWKGRRGSWRCALCYSFSPPSPENLAQLTSPWVVRVRTPLASWLPSCLGTAAWKERRAHQQGTSSDPGVRS